MSIEIDEDNGKTIKYKLKLIDSYRFMQSSLSSLVDNFSGTDNKELKDTMMKSLPQSINNKISQTDKKESENKIWQSYQKILQIDRKELKNKFVDSVRSKMVSLKQSINKILQIGEKEAKNKCIDNMRSIDKVSQATLIE